MKSRDETTNAWITVDISISSYDSIIDKNF